MHVALIGTRGVPAAYGGFETAVEEVGRRLAMSGHLVTVYCRGRKNHTVSYCGMTTVDLPTLRRRSLETLSHSFLSVIHAVTLSRPDVAIVFNAANSPLLPFLRIAGVPCALHTDGLEWLRGKWGPMGKRYYRIAEALGVHFADALISDAEGIAAYYTHRYNAKSVTIPYGANLVETTGARINELGLREQGYYLVVARLEPENHVDMILRGYMLASTELPIVVVGSIPYPSSHSRELEALARGSSRIRMLGALWDQELLDSLYSGAALYLHGHSVGGTNPSLLRAMGAGAPIAAYDVIFNREVLMSDEEVYWKNEEDVARIISAVEDGQAMWRGRAELARKRASEAYRWDDVASGYERLACNLHSGYSTRLPGFRRLGGVLRAASNSSAGRGPWTP